MKDSLKDGLASFSLYTVSFTVADLMNSINWYRNIFGFKLISRNSFKTATGWTEVVIIEAGGIRLELSNLPREKYIETRFVNVPTQLQPLGDKAIVLQVNDIAVAGIELEKKGVEFVWADQLVAEEAVICITIKDPDGNKINIFQANFTIKK